MGKKDINDKFYTDENIARFCINFIDNLSFYDKVIEPSAGNGAFSKYIAHNNIESYDIAPENDSIKQMDWFDFNKDLTNCLIIGNPPFGERNRLSKMFIEHCIKLNAHTIAFILPNVYHKHTLQAIFTKEYRLQKFVELPKNSFTLNGEVYHVPCTFFVWTKFECEDLRFDISKFKTDDFEFIKKDEATGDDFFILGASPNTTKEINDVSKNNRGYYIKPKLKSKTELLSVFSEIKFKGLSSVNGGVAWRTKPEIIKDYVERGK